MAVVADKGNLDIPWVAAVGRMAVRIALVVVGIGKADLGKVVVQAGIPVVDNNHRHKLAYHRAARNNQVVAYTQVVSGRAHLGYVTAVVVEPNLVEWVLVREQVAEVVVDVVVVGDQVYLSAVVVDLLTQFLKVSPLRIFDTLF